MKTTSIITITHDPDEDENLSVKIEFHPAAKTKGPMTPDQTAAMLAVKSLKAGLGSAD